MGRQIQIHEELFFDLARYFLLGQEECFGACQKGIEGKLNRMLDRACYSEAHDGSLTAEEREAARQKYLDRRGIPENFRW